MPENKAGSASSFKNPKFAPLTLNFTFKKVFMQEHSDNLLMFLLNAFLAEKFRYPIKKVKKINKDLLEKTRYNRCSSLDIYCEDANGARFIAGIQVEQQEQAISSLARIEKNFDFNIPKLYTLSFLEFDLDFGKGCTEAVQHLSVRNDKHTEVSYDMLQMAFVILPRFNKAENECKTVMDKVLFAFKNGHKLKSVPKNFTEKEIHQIFEIARVANFTSNEFAEYELAMLNRHDSKTNLENRLDPACIASIAKLPRKQIITLE